MKNLLLLLLPFCFSLLSFGQTPKTISYQGVARNATGQPIPNQSIKIKLSLLETATSSNSLYTETHTPTTTGQGLFALQIGAGTVLNGTYANLDWSNGPKFVKTEIDPAGGDNFTLSSTNPLNSVPFSLYAQNGDKVVTLTGQGATTITGTYPNFVIRSKDSVGTYQPGTGLELNGNTFSGKVNDPLWNANKLQGRTIDPTAPTNKDVLKWNGTNWKTGKDSVNTYSAGTGINITTGLNVSAKNDDAIWNAGKLQGKNVTATQPTKEDFLRYDGSKWVPGKSIPSFTTKQRDSIPTSSISAGYTFFNRNTECLEYYTGSKWLALCGVDDLAGDSLKASDLKEEGSVKLRVLSSPTTTSFDPICELNNKMYLIGADRANCNDINYTLNLYRFDPRKDTVGKVSATPSGFGYTYSPFYFSNNIYFFNNQTSSHKFRIEIYNVVSNSFQTQYISYPSSWNQTIKYLFLFNDNAIFIHGNQWFKINLTSLYFAEMDPLIPNISISNSSAVFSRKLSNDKLFVWIEFFNERYGVYLNYSDTVSTIISSISTSQAIASKLRSNDNTGSVLYDGKRLHFRYDVSGLDQRATYDIEKDCVFLSTHLFGGKNFPTFQIGNRYYFIPPVSSGVCQAAIYEIKFY